MHVETGRRLPETRHEVGASFEIRNQVEGLGHFLVIFAIMENVGLAQLSEVGDDIRVILDCEDQITSGDIFVGSDLMPGFRAACGGGGQVVVEATQLIFSDVSITYAC